MRKSRIVRNHGLRPCKVGKTIHERQIEKKFGMTPVDTIEVQPIPRTQQDLYTVPAPRQTPSQITKSLWAPSFPGPCSTWNQQDAAWHGVGVN
jgi:hypothetical protein|tara:strand:- start:15 stop:293 length:279 start_codon:yes stop_codon:yes gene_type:complete